MSFRLELNLNVCTRVPQKLRGYLHSGHAKAAQRDKGRIKELRGFAQRDKGCIKELRGFAHRDKGCIIIRFDPAKQSNEFVENILNDLDARGIKGEIATRCIH